MRTLVTLILAMQAAVAAAATPAPVKPATPQTVVLAGGCFWGVEGVYEHMRGVQSVVAGYAGGDQKTATYDQVSTGRTGHAESVKITFDPAQVTYADILRVFFSVAHDPTQLNRQGPDVGTQYRSVDLLRERRAARSRPLLHRRAEQVRQVPARARDARGPARGVLPGRALPPGLPRQEPPKPLHRGARPAEAPGAEGPVSGVLPGLTARFVSRFQPFRGTGDHSVKGDPK